MYICPECGEKLNKNATICPCCGRGNKNTDNRKCDIIIILVGFILLGIGIVNSISFAYEEKKTIYEGTNYSFVYRNKDWFESDKYKAVNSDAAILVYNSNEQDKVSYIQFEKEMTEVNYNTDVDSSREDLYKDLYREMIYSRNKEYSNISSGFKQIGDKYYLEANYNNGIVKGKIYVVCYKTKLLSFYLIYEKNNSKIEKALIDIIETIEIK